MSSMPVVVLKDSPFLFFCLVINGQQTIVELSSSVHLFLWLLLHTMYIHTSTASDLNNGEKF